MRELLESEKWKDLLDKFFFEFEEYQADDPLKTTKSFLKVPFKDIAAFYNEHSEEYLPFILIPLEYIENHAVFKYESLDSDLEF